VLRLCLAQLCLVVAQYGDAELCESTSYLALWLDCAGVATAADFSGATMAAADDEAVESFIAENSLDESAARSLRGESAQVKQIVIDRGSLVECANPSSALIGRIRDAKLQVPRAVPGAGPSEATPEEVDKFISENALDDSAAQHLRTQAPAVQRNVIDRGSLTECTNPSSAVIGRIRDAKLQAKYGTSAPMSARLGATAAVPAATPASPAGFANGAYGYGSSAVPGQMGQMNMMGFYQQQGMQMPGYYPMMAYMTPEQQQQAAQAYAAAAAGYPGYGAYTGYGMAMTPGMNPTQAYGGMAASAASAQPAQDGGAGGSTASSGEVESFIASNRLDATAAQNLRAEPPHIQRVVIDRGSLAECVNPSSAVIGRIRDAKLDAKYGRPGAGAAPVAGGGCGALTASPGMPLPVLDGRFATPQEVEQFIADSRLDDGAARAMRAEPPQVQTAVINRGSLAECLNPSSAVIGRIRDAKLQVKYPDRVAGGALPAAGMGGGVGGESSSEVEQFIRENHLDDGAAKALRSTAQEVQLEVVNRGTLLDCTNPSSAVMGRIREAKQARGGGAGAGAYGPTSTAPLLRSSPY